MQAPRPDTVKRYLKQPLVRLSTISWRDLINETWVSKPLPVAKALPSDEALFGDAIEKLAKAGVHA